jgi:hypothetical protein
MITPGQALDIALAAARQHMRIDPGSPIEVRLHDAARYIVTFVHLNAPGVRGPDYDARVTLDATTGEVLEILAAS